MKRKKEKSGKMMALIIAIIMVSSIAGYVILDSSAPNKQEYNGYKLERNNDGTYSTEIEGMKIDFNFHPAEVVGIPFTDNDIAELRSSNTIMITSDIGSPLQRGISLLEFELENNLRPFGILITHGFTEEGDLPVINCSMADDKNPVLYIQKGNATDVERDDSCFYVTARNEVDVVMIKDALLYRILGIL